MLRNDSNSFDITQSSFMLKEGETFYDTTTGNMYIGDGVNPLSSLYENGKAIVNAVNANGAKVNTELDFSYNDETHEASVKKYTGTSYYSGDITIPRILLHSGKLYTVTGIEDKAFYDCTGLTGIKLPSSIKCVGTNAFANCTGLGNGNLEYYGDLSGWCKIIFKNVFSNPLYWTHTLVIGGVSVLGTQGSNATVRIPSDITCILNYTFIYAKYINGVRFPFGLTSLGEGAFEYCSNLCSGTCVELPLSLKSIGLSCFFDCTSIEEIRTSSDSAPNGTMVIPSANVIDQFCFMRCTELTSVTLPDGLLSIGAYAFSGCEKLGSVNLPGSVSTIGGGAFTNVGTDVGGATITLQSYSGAISGSPWSAPSGTTFIYSSYNKYVAMSDCLSNGVWYEAVITDMTSSPSYNKFTNSVDGGDLYGSTYLFKVVAQLDPIDVPSSMCAHYRGIDAGTVTTHGYNYLGDVFYGSDFSISTDDPTYNQGKKYHVELVPFNVSPYSAKSLYLRIAVTEYSIVDGSVQETTTYLNSGTSYFGDAYFFNKVKVYYRRITQ